MSLDIGQTNMNFGNPMRVLRGFSLAQKGGPFPIRSQHRLKQAGRAIGCLLGHQCHARIGGHCDRPLIRSQLTGQEFEQGALATTVTPHQPHLVPSRNPHTCPVQQNPAADPVTDIIDVQHCIDIQALRRPNLCCDSFVYSSPSHRSQQNAKVKGRHSNGLWFTLLKCSSQVPK